MNSYVACDLVTFKKHWSVKATGYPVTNNDAALVFRAISDLVMSPYRSNPQTTNLDQQIEYMAACFPDRLAPLCREMAKACITAQTLQPIG